MPLRTAEAFVLRTYPLRESDKIVSFFTREFGKCRGVARAARRPKSKFGSTLEPLSRVHIQFFEREGKDLAAIDHCELLDTLWTGVAGEGIDLLQSVAASLMVEVADRMLPEREVNDAVFRLKAAVLPALRSSQAPWLPLTYDLLWMVRLGGFLPTWTAGSPGAPSGAALALAERLRRWPLPELGAGDAGAAAGPAGLDLRQKLKWCLEDHLEAGLKCWPLLASLEPAGAGAPAR